MIITTFKEKTDDDLIHLIRELYASIYIIGCYSSHDLLRYDTACSELDGRGYFIQEKKELVITKEDQDD